MYLAVNDEQVIIDTNEISALDAVLNNSNPKTYVYLKNGIKLVVLASVADLVAVLGWNLPDDRSGSDQYVVLENSSSKYQ